MLEGSEHLRMKPVGYFLSTNVSPGDSLDLLFFLVEFSLLKPCLAKAFLHPSQPVTKALRGRRALHLPLQDPCWPCAVDVHIHMFSLYHCMSSHPPHQDGAGQGCGLQLSGSSPLEGGGAAVLPLCTPQSLKAVRMLVLFGWKAGGGVRAYAGVPWKSFNVKNVNASGSYHPSPRRVWLC